MIKVVLLAAILLALESALLILGLQHPAMITFALLLALHTLLCLCSTVLMYRMLPDGCREPHRAVMGLLFALAFFVPVAGSVALWLILHVILRWPALAKQGDFRAVVPPEFALQGDHLQVRFGAGGVRARLADRQAPSESRLEALLAIKAMPQRLSSSILRSLLDDPEEDLRLLAYGMLDNEEKNINEQINLALNEYRTTTDEKMDIARRLALLYWELVYQNLVTGDVRHYALQEARRYADETLMTAPQDAGIWVLRGKIRSANADWDGAHEDLLQGQRLGFPATRLTPYLAEHAFRQRRFDEVKDLLKSMDSLAVGDMMHPVIRFWTKHED